MQFLHTDDVSWHEPSGHVRGYSKFLVDPGNMGSRYFDFRLSRYPPGGTVTVHTHGVAEHVYYFIEGSAEAVCGDETQTVGPGTVMFVRPKVPHSLVNTGDGDLVFVVVTSPPTDIAR